MVGLRVERRGREKWRKKGLGVSFSSFSACMHDIVVWCMLVLAGNCAGGGREGWRREGGRKGMCRLGVLVATLLI